jgi:hypothetical protein
MVNVQKRTGWGGEQAGLSRRGEGKAKGREEMGGNDVRWDIAGEARPRRSAPAVRCPCPVPGTGHGPWDAATRLSERDMITSLSPTAPALS